MPGDRTGRGGCLAPPRPARKQTGASLRHTAAPRLRGTSYSEASSLLPLYLCSVVINTSFPRQSLLCLQAAWWLGVPPPSVALSGGPACSAGLGTLNPARRKEGKLSSAGGTGIAAGAGHGALVPGVRGCRLSAPLPPPRSLVVCGHGAGRGDPAVSVLGEVAAPCSCCEPPSPLLSS